MEQRRKAKEHTLISLLSRYSGSEVYFVKDPKTGTTVTTVMRSVIPTGAYSGFHVWSEGDRVDTLSNKMNNPPHMWWTMFDRNGENIDPLSVPVGAVVLVR